LTLDGSTLSTGTEASQAWIDLPQNPLPPPELRPTIVPVFLPHAGCAHRCIFCNQNAITGQDDPGPAPDLSETVDRFLGGKRRSPDRVELAFYGSNFLGQKEAQIDALLSRAHDLIRLGWIGSVRCSTRPDSIDDQRLALIAGRHVATVELGGQSMDDDVLAACRRGHSSHDTALAVDRLRRAGYRVGIQMMIGLPGQDERSAIRSAARFADLKPDFVRIYPCLVLAGSPLAAAYRQGAYRPLSLQQAVTTTGRIWRVFARRRIPVIRMGLQAAPELSAGHSLIAGPYDPAFGHLVHSALCHDALVRLLKRWPTTSKTVEIIAHPCRSPQVRGHRNANLAALMRRFALTNIRVKADPFWPPQRLGLTIQKPLLSPSRVKPLHGKLF